MIGPMIGLMVELRSTGAQPGDYLQPAWAKASYVEAHQDPAGFCSGLRFMAQVNLWNRPKLDFTPTSDKVVFNGETLVCPRDTSKPPYWERR